MVRKLACLLRGDDSEEILSLSKTPSISIDLPMSKQGYEVKADEVFWVSQGILLSTDLRDSMDEQCIADIAVCIIGGTLIDRSKDALDQIYMRSSLESERVAVALEVYGADKFSDEFKFCVDQLLEVCADGTPTKLRELIFQHRTTNAFPSVFAVILIAFHKLFFIDGMIISNYSGLKRALTNIVGRIERGRKATSPEERQKNISTVKALIAESFTSSGKPPDIYNNHSTTDINSIIRRSEVELSNYELKQGLLSLSPKRAIDPNIVNKISRTICAIANIGPHNIGKIIIGVADKDADAVKISALDSITPLEVYRRKIVGVSREARALSITPEAYLAKWRDGIRNSGLSEPLLSSVLSNIDFNSYFGLGLIIITIPSQNEVSYINDEIYWRNMDNNEKAETAKQIAGIVGRF